MKTKNITIILSTSVLLLFSACKGHKEDKKDALPNETISVKTKKVTLSENTRTITATGLITTENEAKYSFKIGGVIDKIFVKEGQSFSSGQLLATLKLTEIDAGVIQAKLGLEKSQRDYQRITNLFKDSVATLEQMQNSKTSLDLAQKQLDAISFNKQYASIYANTTGFVTKKIANEGEVIAGGYPVFSINENTDGAWVLRAGFSDKDWANIQIGDKAEVCIDAYPNKVFVAIVSKKSQAAEQTSGSFMIEFKLETGTIKPAVGMYAKAVIATTEHTHQQSIPYGALVEADGNKAFVFVPTNKTHVKKVPITIESFDNNKIRVLSGLENVEEIIISNSAFLNENSSITILK